MTFYSTQRNTDDFVLVAAGLLSGEAAEAEGRHLGVLRARQQRCRGARLRATPQALRECSAAAPQRALSGLALCKHCEAVGAGGVRGCGVGVPGELMTGFHQNMWAPLALLPDVQTQ